MSWQEAPLVENKWESAPIVEERKKVGKVGAAGLGMADMSSFGFDDELRGFGRAIGSKIRGDERPFSELANLGQQEVKSQHENAQQDHPGYYLGGQIAGAAIPAFTAPGAEVANWARVGGLGARTAKGGAIGAVSSGLYGAGATDGGAVDRLKGAAPYAVAGGALGATLPLAGAGLKTAASSITDKSLPKASEAGSKAYELAKKYNIPIGLDDITDSKFYKTLISEGSNLPLSNSTSKITEQNKAFTQAISKSIGMDTDKLSVEAIDDAFTRIGKEFDDLTKGQSFQINDDVAEAYNEILSVAEAGGYGAEGKNLLNQYLKDMGAVTDNAGEVSGESLGKLRAKLNLIGRRASDQNAKTIARDLESMISNFITDGSPEALQQAKYRYKNLIAIEPLASKDQLGGQIAPSQLLGRVRQVYGRQFSRGKAGELGDLANIGQFIKETIPNSGTSQRTLAKNVLTGNALGMVPTYLFGGPLAAAAQAGLSGAALAGNRALQNKNFDQELLAEAIRKTTQTKQVSSKAGAISKILGSK